MICFKFLGCILSAPLVFSFWFLPIFFGFCYFCFVCDWFTQGCCNAYSFQGRIESIFHFVIFVGILKALNLGKRKCRIFFLSCISALLGSGVLLNLLDWRCSKLFIVRSIANWIRFFRLDQLDCYSGLVLLCFLFRRQDFWFLISVVT